MSVMMLIPSLLLVQWWEWHLACELSHTSSSKRFLFGTPLANQLNLEWSLAE